MSQLSFILLLPFFLFQDQELKIGETITPKQILQKMEDTMRGKTNRGVFEMTITTPNWERTLRMKSWEKGLKKSLIRITAPPKEEGISSLKIGNNMWNYLPKVERTIKIPPSMMLQSWMGSDFTNDDLVKESSIVNDYDHKVLGIEERDGVRAYKVEAIPKPNAPVVWGKLIYWIRVIGFLPLREEFFNERNELIKAMTFSGIRKMHGRVIPTHMEMVSLKKKGHKTVIKIVDIKFDIRLSDNLFTLSNLKRVR